MTGKPDFTISAAIHKAFVDVNETGTEAAAATSVIMRATAMRQTMPEPPPIIFRADHPFLFLIRDTKTGAILFMGRVADPTK
jgi:serpin B